MKELKKRTIKPVQSFMANEKNLIKNSQLKPLSKTESKHSKKALRSLSIERDLKKI